MSALAHRPAARRAQATGSTPRGVPHGILFAADFNDEAKAAAPDPDAAEPEPPAPLFTRAEMDGARADGFREGLARALAEEEARMRLAVLAELAASLRQTRAEAASMAERMAEDLARLLLAALAAVLPELCRRHGDAEARAVVRQLLPGLAREPRATVRAHALTLAALQTQIDGLDPEAAAMLVLTPAPAMAEGDVRITWHQGSALREASAIWREIEAVLAPAGLIVPRMAPKKESVDA